MIICFPLGFTWSSRVSGSVQSVETPEEASKSALIHLTVTRSPGTMGKQVLILTTVRCFWPLMSAAKFLVVIALQDQNPVRVLDLILAHLTVTIWLSLSLK